jgi:hypothetical protein
VPSLNPSVVRFTDFATHSVLPSDESLGYCQPSASAEAEQCCPFPGVKNLDFDGSLVDDALSRLCDDTLE